MRLLIIMLFAASVAWACTDSNENTSITEPVVEGRWYTQRQFDLGKKVFMQNCSSCHGTRAQGIVEDWRQRNPDGTFPAPPLDGSAHAWHHSLEVLARQINEGGIKLGGTMPAFGDSLSDSEVIAVIAYFQSYWDETTYNRWVQMNAEN